MSDASLDLFLPDRFDVLRDRSELDVIVMPVESGLSMIDDQFSDIPSSGFGAMIILRGESGAGKTTFLDTIPMFRPGVSAVRIPYGESVIETLESLQPIGAPRLIIIEGREALGRVAESEIEEGLHAINSFLRTTPAGRESLVVWPTNSDSLSEKLSSIADVVGASALIGTDEVVYRFSGPPKSDWVTIAEQTTAALNAGASLAAYGISAEQAAAMVSDSPTLGHYLKRIRKLGQKNTRPVSVLEAAERCRVWTVVISAGDSEGDVAALTRGGFSQVDIDRIFTATGANSLADMKKQPEKYGLLGMVLDARIVHVDALTALAVARTFGDEKLKAAMSSRGMDTKRDAQAISRIQTSQLGLLLSGSPLGTRKRGPKEGSNTKIAINNLIDITKTNDSLCNRAFGEALKTAGIVADFEVEKTLSGGGMSRRTDLYVHRENLNFRLEFMWRADVGRADIANYVLGKLVNYGKLTGYLD
ncbi:hypothetical protein KG112_16630 [Nocardioides sp. zg-ZUI104]|uniref:hypothetical protein n=1 Tax=Nocardioides faecalis TaxID=2803858 RepID=UPI001BD05DFB|nr:hypothetical protein [Nocardioides faecalis]MBS4754435.1 hypothetical protein [Nocardioides faecalis]